MIYLYITFETTKKCTEGPTEIDIQAIENGELQVIRVSHLGVHELVGDEWVDVEEAEIVQTHGQSWHE